MGSRDRPPRKSRRSPRTRAPSRSSRRSRRPRSRRRSSRSSASRGGTKRAAKADTPGGRGPGPAPSGSAEAARSEDQHDDHRQGNRPQRRDDKALAERGKAVDAAILAIEKQFGRGSIMKLGSAERQAVDSIPTGLDRPRPRARRGRHPARPDHGDLRPRVVGQDHASASTSSRRPSARAAIAAFIDVEHALDPGYARACGVNVDELLVSASRTPASRPSRSPRP